MSTEPVSSKPVVAFLGLGAMGLPMANNLLKTGLPARRLESYGRPRRRSRRCWGARSANSPRAAAEQADVVITMLTDVSAVEGVAFGADGLLGGLREGAIYVDMSTVTPAMSRRLGAVAAERGARFLDAPVTGTIGPAAAEGTLTFIVGGDAALLDDVRPLLDIMGSTIIHAGSVGQGSWLKLLANALMGVSMQAFFELLALGQRAGFDRETLARTLGGMPSASPVMQRKTPSILSGDFSPQFTLDLFEKDLRQLLDAAGELGVDQPLVAQTQEQFADAARNGRGDRDYAVAALAAEERPGIER